MKLIPPAEVSPFVVIVCSTCTASGSLGKLNRVMPPAPTSIPGALTFVADNSPAVIERVETLGDLFRPMVELEQALPKL